MDGYITRRCFLKKSLKVGAGIMLASEIPGSVGSGLGSDVKDFKNLAVAEGDAREVSDRVIFMEDGKIIEVGTAEHFFTSPEEERTRLFLSQIL